MATEINEHFTFSILKQIRLFPEKKDPDKLNLLPK